MNKKKDSKEEIRDNLTIDMFPELLELELLRIENAQLREELGKKKGEPSVKIGKDEMDRLKDISEQIRKSHERKNPPPFAPTFPPVWPERPYYQPPVSPPLYPTWPGTFPPYICGPDTWKYSDGT